MRQAEGFGSIVMKSTTVQHIVIVGGGFAGLWSALGAVRKRGELGLNASHAKITLINRNNSHTIRVRLYESDLSDVCVPLDHVLGLADIGLVTGEVTEVDPEHQFITVESNQTTHRISYDRLVLAAGSKLYRPKSVEGLEYSFDVDTFSEAQRLHEHLASLSGKPRTVGTATVLVVGAGLTGLEVACEMPRRLRSILQDDNASRVRVIIVDHASRIGSDMGEEAGRVIEEALRDLGIESRVGVVVSKVDPNGVTLSTGEKISAETVIWTAGMRASELTEKLPVPRDSLGRVGVDEFLRVKNLSNVFAAGDIAKLFVDGSHASVMSCQHARPMGRFAGHNVVADLFNKPMLPLTIPDYVTILDLGEWGALYTSGWERTVIASGKMVKLTKQEINHRRIYPPVTSLEAILEAAAPVVQNPPALDLEGSCS